VLSEMKLSGIDINEVSVLGAFAASGCGLTQDDLSTMITAAVSVANCGGFADNILDYYTKRMELEAVLRAGTIANDRNATAAAKIALLREVVAGPVMSSAEQAVYEQSTGKYWVPNAQGGYTPIESASLRRMLKGLGFSPEKPADRYLSPLEEKINRIELENSVAYAGPLAGARIGIQESCGNRILVTSEAKRIEPVKGEHPIIDRLLDQCFITDGINQIPYVLGWLKFAVEAQRAGSPMPGQIMIMAGPRECGKSLWQHIFTEILGGRAGKPYRYIIGGTEFNAELIGCEHLALEDECPSSDIRHRRNLGARIKDLTVNRDISCHGKHRQAILLQPCWRVSMSLNDEPENLNIIPPLDESLADKVMLLKIGHHPMPLETGTNEARKAFWEAIMAELAAFIHTILTHDVPDHLRSPRFGVKHFHHPELIEEMDELAPETRMLRYINETLFQGGPLMSWRGTAEHLQRELCAGPYGSESRRLLDWSNAAGTYLEGSRPSIPRG
jgi:hypothetical protein